MFCWLASWLIVSAASFAPFSAPGNTMVALWFCLSKSKPLNIINAGLGKCKLYYGLFLLNPCVLYTARGLSDSPPDRASWSDALS